MPEHHPPPEELRLRHAAVTQLQTSLLTTRTTEDFLQRVVEGAAQHVGPRIACTLTMLREGTLRHRREHRRARHQGRRWWSTRSTPGPASTRRARGWRASSPTCATTTAGRSGGRRRCELGFLSAAAVPGDTGDGGAQISMNLYGRELEAFGEPEMRRARVYVEEVARALRLSLLLAQQATLAEHLETAMLSRSTIDQALGVIMGQNRTTRDEAFEILRAASQSRNVKLRDVAALIIQNLTGHAAADPPPFDRGDRSPGTT